MIKNIYSLKNPRKILNIIYHQEIKKGALTKVERTTITESKNYLQAMHIKLPTGTEIAPHKHIIIKRKTTRTHEGLIVLEGSIELTIFDIDKKLVRKEILTKGDFTILINGGHSLKVLKHASVFEFKNGPYLGKDKINF